MSEPSPPAAAEATRRDPSFLIIEQSSGTILLLKEALAELHPETCISTESHPRRLLSGLVTMARREAPDAIIVGLDWRDLLRRDLLATIATLAAWWDAPILVLANEQDADYLAACRAAGATTTRPKPSTWLSYRALAWEMHDQRARALLARLPRRIPVP